MSLIFSGIFAVIILFFFPAYFLLEITTENVPAYLLLYYFLIGVLLFPIIM